MLLPDWAFLDAVVHWMGNGLFDLAWWQMVLITLGLTHITIASVTIFLHRHQATALWTCMPSPRTSSVSGCG